MTPKPLFDWCFFDKLGLNWSKTCFVAKRRVKLPPELNEKQTINFIVSKVEKVDQLIVNLVLCLLTALNIKFRSV
jgi:hypothetical protein